MTQEKNYNQTQISCLLATLTDLQQSIRTYDTKAQIMGVGFIFSITMIGKFMENLTVDRTYGIVYLFVGFIILVGPVILYGTVLYPTRRNAPKTTSEHASVHHCLYFRSDDTRGLEAYLQNINSADWTTELAYEIIRFSALRDLKRRRFILAIFASSASFIVILVGDFINLLKLTG